MRLAITEDGLVVYNIYLEDIPGNFTVNKLQEHFSSFGEVSSVEIRWNSEKTMRYALVNFKDAESAASTLYRQNHFIWDGLKLVRKVVKKADSWWQPNFEIKIESASLIMMLNDDCLLHIFSFLPTWERIKLSRLNQRFKHIFEISTIRNKTVNLSNLTLMEIRFIWREFGHLIQKIDLEVFGSKMERRSRNQYRVPNFVTKYCSELRHLNFVNLSINENTKFSLLRNLTKISLRYADIADKVCFNLSKLENLQYLDVSGNVQLTGEYLKDFPELIHLNLDGCIRVQEGHISEFCSSSRIIQKLKSLNIKNCCSKIFEYSLSSRMIQKLKSFNIKNCCSSRNTFAKLAFLENLECLVISSEAELSVIKDIKKLKHLIIYVAHHRIILDSVCQKLAYCTSLETLFIVNDCFYRLKITEKNIFSMTSIKKLGLLCFALDDEDMTKIAAMSELTHLNIAGCELNNNSDLSHLFEKSNNLQHVEIHGFLPYCNYMASSEMIDAIRIKIKETGRTTHCTLYGSEYADKIENSSLLKVVGSKSVFPGMKLRDPSKYIYEFEYHID